MNWLIIIMVAVVAELIIRYLTRGMEDKRKRRSLSLFMGGFWSHLNFDLVCYEIACEYGR